MHACKRVREAEPDPSTDDRRRPSACLGGPVVGRRACVPARGLVRLRLAARSLLYLRLAACVRVCVRERVGTTDVARETLRDRPPPLLPLASEAARWRGAGSSVWLCWRAGRPAGGSRAREGGAGAALSSDLGLAVWESDEEESLPLTAPPREQATTGSATATASAIRSSSMPRSASSSTRSSGRGARTTRSGSSRPGGRRWG